MRPRKIGPYDDNLWRCNGSLPSLPSSSQSTPPLDPISPHSLTSWSLTNDEEEEELDDAVTPIESFSGFNNACRDRHQYQISDPQDHHQDPTIFTNHNVYGANGDDSRVRGERPEVLREVNKEVETTYTQIERGSDQRGQRRGLLDGCRRK